MHCVLDIPRYHAHLVETGDVFEASMTYYETDDAGFALRCLGMDLTSSSREAPALAGYVRSMGVRGCTPDEIVRFLHRYAARVAHDERIPETGWRVYSWMHRDTRLRWESATRLRAV